MFQTFADSRKKRISATTAEPPLSLVRYAGRPINTTSPAASLASQLVHFFLYPKIQPVRPRLLPTKTKENTPKESTEERGTPTSTKPCLVAPAFCGKRTLLLYNRAQTFLHPTFHPCSQVDGNTRQRPRAAPFTPRPVALVPHHHLLNFPPPTPFEEPEPLYLAFPQFHGTYLCLIICFTCRFIVKNCQGEGGGGRRLNI